MAKCFSVCIIDVHQLAAVVKNRIDNILILDSRSFLEFNSSHVNNAVNVGCAKLMKRRLQQDRLNIQDFLSHSCHWDVDTNMDIVIYDQNTFNPGCLPDDCFVSVFLQKMLLAYKRVNFLRGGFLEFQAAYPNLCEDEKMKFTPLTSLSQPCLPISDHGPTRILPFLYLGSQHDALNKEVLQNHSITYELNVSTNCPKPEFIKEAHFMRIPVIDNYSEKLLPHFPKAFQFLDKVRESGGCALVHCLAGISRSATVAIAYVMQHLKMSSDEAYRYVKSKRATISPNFNFLGQLLEYENQLQKEKILSPKAHSDGSHSPSIQGPSIVHVERNGTNETSYSSVITKHQEPEPNSTCITQVWHSVSDEFGSSTNKQLLSVKQAVKSTFSRQRKSQKIKDWSTKCIPVSSLKELSFTPCQSALLNGSKSTKSSERLQDSDSWSKVDCFVRTNLVHTESVEDTKCETAPKKTNKFNFTLFDNVLSECKLEPFKSLRSLSSSSRDSLISSREVPKSPFQDSCNSFDSKDYNRSDSNSTSGLGSESSDCYDSWNEFTSSCERESDMAMEDECGMVPMEEDEYQKQKMLGFDSSYEEPSLYGKYDSFFLEQKSPLSPKAGPFSLNYLSDVNRCQGFSKTKKDQAAIENRQNERLVQSPNIMNSKCETLVKSDGLYRAQSCPGILSTDPVPWIPQGKEAIPITATNPNLRRPRTSNKYQTDKQRNRYSCSSLDYMEQGAQVGILKSCPNVPSYTSSSTTENATTLSPSHQLYRHSMIEVS